MYWFGNSSTTLFRGGLEGLRVRGQCSLTDQKQNLWKTKRLWNSAAKHIWKGLINGADKEVRTDFPFSLEPQAPFIWNSMCIDRKMNMEPFGRRKKMAQSSWRLGMMTFIVSISIRSLLVQKSGRQKSGENFFRRWCNIRLHKES